ncbi:MAG: RNA-binding ATPase activator esf2 [Sclerophora amabilis]|nr:MAG: RNA-binding ATPase activator esf2 [Sclerophora amabilis]
MTETRKRGNEWLDADVSDDDVGEDGEQQGYDSEAAEERKGSRTSIIPVRRTKRRRREELEDHSDGEEGEDQPKSMTDNDGSSVEEDEDLEEYEDGHLRSKHGLPSASAAEHSESPIPNSSFELENDLSPSANTKTNPNLKPLTPAQLEAHNRRLRKTGVIYLSRIPPYMSPSKIRSLLTPHGAINRIFLTPESDKSHSTRVRSHGNRKRSFVDGWVEFVSKRDAKLAAETLNAQIVGGKKGSWYHDDLWNVKYLRGFKWADLVEQVRNEEAERAGRLRVGRERGRREEKEFLKGVERAKVWEGKERKKKERAAKTATISSSKDEPSGSLHTSSTNQADGRPGPSTRPFVRNVRQNSVKIKSNTGEHDEGKTDAKPHRHPEELRRVLSKIF